MHQGILKGGGVSLYCWSPVFGKFGLVCFANKNKNCQLSYSWFKTIQTGGQQYSDTPPFSIPWLNTHYHAVLPKCTSLFWSYFIFDWAAWDSVLDVSLSKQDNICAFIHVTTTYAMLWHFMSQIYAFMSLIDSVMTKGRFSDILVAFVCHFCVIFVSFLYHSCIILVTF